MPQHSQDSPQGALIGLGLMMETLEDVLPGILINCELQVRLNVNGSLHLIAINN